MQQYTIFVKKEVNGWSAACHNPPVYSGTRKTLKELEKSIMDAIEGYFESLEQESPTAKYVFYVDGVQSADFNLDID